MNENYLGKYKVPPTPTEKCKSIVEQHKHLPDGTLEVLAAHVAAGEMTSADLDWISTVSVIAEVPLHEVHAFYFGVGIGLGLDTVDASGIRSEARLASIAARTGKQT